MRLIVRHEALTPVEEAQCALERDRLLEHSGIGQHETIPAEEPRAIAAADTVDDARHAVCHARRQGVRVACLLTDGRHAGAARRIFGAGGVAMPSAAQELPRALRGLIG